MSGYDRRSNGERIATFAAVRASLTPLGYQRVSIGTGAPSGLTPPVGARLATIQAEGANIRYRDFGGAPTASIGMRLLSTSTTQEYVGTLSAVQFIAEGAGAFLNIAYYG
ncbi:hypothetical protein [Luteibacter sp. RCC_6_2]|uniref:hypothetical protein n=1 Tax=Luteibacter sp. RCC_6_2 TaxID=3239223 RepID=UPI003524672A